MTYIPKPNVNDSAITGTINPSKIAGTAAAQTTTNDFTNLNTIASITAASGVVQKYTASTSGSGLTVTSSTGYHTIETASGFSGNLVLQHSESDAGWVLNIKNTRGTSLTVDGSQPSSSVTATLGANGSNAITITSSPFPTNAKLDQLVTGTYIGAGSQITSINSNTGVVGLSVPLTETITGVTGVTSTDTFTKSEHGLSNGTAVRLSALTGGSNLSTSTTYYVILSASSTFKLSTTVNGSAVDLGSDVSSVTVVRYRTNQSITFQSFIDFTSNSGNTDIIPESPTISVASGSSITLISTGIYWIRIR